MKRHKLKLFEVLNLEAEIAGLTNQNTGERVIEGLISQKISAVTKYWLNSVLDTLEKEKKMLNDLRDELIKKYGDEDTSGRIGVNQRIETGEKDEQGNPIFTMSPKYIEFMNEYNTVLQESKEIKLPEINLHELSRVETSDNYQLIFKYMVKAPNEESVEHLVKVVE
jgi:hypothetical protein